MKVGTTNRKTTQINENGEEVAILLSEFAEEEELTENNLNETGSLSVFPNPATNIVNISVGNNQTIRRITVIEMTGKQLLSIPANSKVAEFSVSNLKSGTYIINIETDNGDVHTSKFVVEK